MEYKIVLDPGHGGEKPGAVDGIEKDDNIYTEEDNINLLISSKIYKILLQRGYNVILTRTKDQTVSLQQRCKIANEYKADIFVSIHNNASTTKDAEGSEILYEHTSKKGQKLAEYIRQSLVEQIKRVDRGLKSRNDIYILENTNMPAVIVEAAFITNPTEEKLLHSDGFQLLIAKGIVNGIDRYFKGGEQMSEENTLDIVWAFLYGFVKKILNSIVNNLWDELWVEIIKGVNEAEQKWEEAGEGEAKKEWVMEQVMNFINKKTDLSWIQKKIVYIFASKTIDALIDTFNNELGKDWGNKVKEWKEMIEGKIPFID